MRTVLPINLPPIGAFCHQALIHAILSTNIESAPWLHSNYIQIYCLKDLIKQGVRNGTLDFYYNFYGDFRFYEHSTCPWLLMNRYPRDVVKDKWQSEYYFIKERLMANEYVFLILDRKYYFNTEYSSYHPVLIYGYDDEEETFYVADNNISGKYELQSIKYELFLKSLEVPDEEVMSVARTEGICTFKIRTYDSDCYKFHLTKVIMDLQDYLYPIYSEDLAYVYGIMCYDELLKYYNNINEKERIDIRAISTVVDHKILMSLRLEYMNKNGYISSELVRSYRVQVENQLVASRNLLIKYNITRDKKLKKRCTDILKETALCEENILTDLLNQINSTMLCTRRKGNLTPLLQP